MVSLMDVFIIAGMCCLITALIVFSITKSWLMSLINEILMPLARDVDSIIDVMSKGDNNEK